MKKKARARAESSSNPDKNPGHLPAKGGMSRRLAFSVIIFAIAVSAAVWFGFGNSGKRGTEAYVPRPRGAVTFNKDIAPIIFNHCAGCHRPGQAAPFELLSYGDVRKHAKQIMEVTERRYMPPWLPEPECGEFADSRRLTTEQIGIIRQWVTEGAVEGAASDLPLRPQWTEGWQLGEPDLVVTMPQPYTLPAEGRDVYRNFVIPIPLPAVRYVRAVEFRPGNWKVVHHAFLKLDTTRDSRLRDEADPEPGFDGIHAPPNAQPPSGHFLSWQPGKVVSAGNDGLAWRLEKDTDLVLQMHLRPSGKPEQLQSSVGFYFTDRAPTNTPIKTWMNSYTIDIPAGKKDYVLEQNYTLPCDVDVLGVLPHAHYLGKELQAWAMLPDGAKQRLICIRDWDFNWQGDYRYAHPVFLPKDTVIHMRYTYDNSAGNPRNPHQPPERVQYGLQSSDEMGELWLQLLPRDAAGLEALRRDNESRILENSVAYNQYLLRLNPNDARAGVGLGRALLLQSRSDEAFRQFQNAAQTQPEYDEPHYYLGILFRLRNKTDSARGEFEQALRLNPDNARAHGNLGVIFMEQGDLDSAETHFQSALRLNPADNLARNNLAQIAQAKARLQNGK